MLTRRIELKQVEATADVARRVTLAGVAAQGKKRPPKPLRKRKRAPAKQITPARSPGMSPRDPQTPR